MLPEGAERVWKGGREIWGDEWRSGGRGIVAMFEVGVVGGRLIEPGGTLVSGIIGDDGSISGWSDPLGSKGVGSGAGPVQS
jgi:hypothetical protein